MHLFDAIMSALLSSAKNWHGFAGFFGLGFVIGIGQTVFANANVSVGSDATNNGNPYSLIAERNAFRLVAASVNPAPPVANPAMETDLKLTGLMRFAGERPRALFASVGKDPKSTEYL